MWECKETGLMDVGVYGNVVDGGWCVWKRGCWMWECMETVLMDVGVLGNGVDGCGSVRKRR
jgi:hypothetical protein